jgi:hypothetical protein
VRDGELQEEGSISVSRAAESTAAYRGEDEEIEASAGFISE